MTADRARGVRTAALLGALLMALSTPAVAATPPRQAPAAGVVASTAPAVITAASMLVSGFRYTGTTTLPSGAGSVTTLTFVVATSSMLDFQLAVPCHPAGGGFNMQFDMAVPPGVAATSPASMTIYATELDYLTADPTIAAPAVPPFRWTVASPPPTHLLAADAGTLSAVRINIVRVDAPTLSLGATRSTSSFC